MLITFSRTLSRIPHLEAFLGERVQWCFRPPQTPPDAVVGWGHKPTAEKARRYAAQRDIPYIAVEDGFLRSLDLGVRWSWTEAASTTTPPRPRIWRTC